MVRVFEEVRQAFKPTDHAHYIFTPRHLTRFSSFSKKETSRWVLSLLRYELGGEMDRLHAMLFYEASRIFGDRLVSDEHKQRYGRKAMILFSFRFEDILRNVAPTYGKRNDGLHYYTFIINIIFQICSTSPQQRSSVVWPRLGLHFSRRRRKTICRYSRRPSIDLVSRKKQYSF